MLVLHLNIHLVNNIPLGQCVSIRKINYDIPASLFPIIGHYAVFNILEHSLVKIPNIIVVGFIPLSRYFEFDDVIPRQVIHRFIKD